MNRVLIPLLALIAGGLIGAAAYPALQPEPHKPGTAKAPSLEPSAPEPSPEATKLRSENDQLRRDLEAARKAANKPEPTEPDVPEKLPEPKPQPKPVPTPPVEPEIVEGEPSAAALARILGREPLSDELAMLEEWLERNPPDAAAINAAIDAGDPEDLLMLLSQNRDARVLDLLKDGDKFETLFERKTPDVFLTADQAKEMKTLPAGAVIDVPVGVHTLDLSSKYPREFPRDILIRGAGKDSTLLRLGVMRTRKGIHQLHFENLTLDCANNYMTDLRLNAPSTIRAKNVRFIRFDMGAGGSVLVAGRSMAFYASDCEFTARFGRSPGSGNPFRSSGIMLVRVENSVFKGPFRDIFTSSEYQPSSDEERYGQGEAFFTGCRFLDCLPDPENEEISQYNCEVTLNRPEKARLWDDLTDMEKARTIRSYMPREPLPLTDLNPMWKED